MSLQDLMKAFGGGGDKQTSGAGGMMGMLGGLMGGGAGGQTGAPSFLQPIITQLGERLHLSPEIASTVAMFAFSKLLPDLLGGRGLPPQATPGTAAGRGAMPSFGARATPGSHTTPQVPPEAMNQNLNDVMQRLGSTPEQQKQYLQQNGYAQQLAQQTGLPENKAAESLQTVLGLFRDHADRAASSSGATGTR